MQTSVRAADPVQLGRALARVRQGQGLSQEALAQRSGLHRSYLASMEGGAATQQLDRLFSVLRALDYELVLRPRNPDAQT